MMSSLQQPWAELQQKANQAWEKKLAPRYHALNESEQRIIRLAAITLPIIILVFGILLPVSDKNAQLHDEVATLSSQALEATRLANQLASNPQAGNQAAQGSLLSQVDKLARQTGVRTFTTKLRPQQIMGKKERLQMQIKDVPYSKIVTFLVALEKNHLPIHQIKIQSTSKGYVHINAVIGG